MPKRARPRSGRPGRHGAAFIRGPAAGLDYSVQQEVPAGDHTIVLLRVEGLYAEPASPPLVLHNGRLRRLSAALTCRNGQVALPHKMVMVLTHRSQVYERSSGRRIARLQQASKPDDRQ